MPKDLDRLKLVILFRLTQGQSGFKKLWDDPEIRSIARSEPILSRALKELESEGRIKKRFFSLKNQPYFITADYEAIRKTMELLLYLEEVQSLSDSAIETFKESKIVEGNQRAVESLFWNTQLVFLKTIQILSQVNPKAEPMARDWFREQFLGTMFELSVFCSKVLPRTTMAAIVNTTESVLQIRPKNGEIENEYLSGITKITEELILKFLETT